MFLCVTTEFKGVPLRLIPGSNSFFSGKTCVFKPVIKRKWVLVSEIVDPFYQLIDSVLSDRQKSRWGLHKLFQTNEYLKPETSRTKVCQSCEDDRPAYRYCHECEDWLCETCTAAHQRVKVTKNHTLTADSDRSETDRSFCEEHPTEELKLYCHQCRMLTCRDCQVDFSFRIQFWKTQIYTEN